MTRVGVVAKGGFKVRCSGALGAVRAIPCDAGDVVRRLATRDELCPVYFSTGFPLALAALNMEPVALLAESLPGQEPESRCPCRTE